MTELKDDLKEESDMRDVMHNQNLLIALGRGPTSFPLTVSG